MYTYAYKNAIVCVCFCANTTAFVRLTIQIKLKRVKTTSKDLKCCRKNLRANKVIETEKIILQFKNHFAINDKVGTLHSLLTCCLTVPSLLKTLVKLKKKIIDR